MGCNPTRPQAVYVPPQHAQASENASATASLNSAAARMSEEPEKPGRQCRLMSVPLAVSRTRLS